MAASTARGCRLHRWGSSSRATRTVAVKLGDEIHEHPQPELVAVQQHELALGAHEPHRALELARALQVAIVRAQRARATLGAGERRGHRRGRQRMGKLIGDGSGRSGRSGRTCGGIGRGTDSGRGRRSVRGGSRRADLRTDRMTSTRACASALPSVACVPLAPPLPPRLQLSCLGILHHDWRRHDLQPCRGRPGCGHGAASRGHESANEDAHDEGRGRRACNHFTAMARGGGNKS